MVSVAIMLLVTTLILANYRGFDNNIVVNGLAYDIGLSIREAQTYGVSVKGFAPQGGSQDFIYPYGISFSNPPTNSYVLFADLDKAGYYVPNHVPSEVVENFSLQGSYIIKDICTKSGTDAPVCGYPSVDITFTRPNPDATIYMRGKVGDQGWSSGDFPVLFTDSSITTPAPDAVIIRVGTRQDNKTTKDIYIYPTGQISIPSTAPSQ